MKARARDLEATSPDFLQVVASLVAIGEVVDARQFANALLCARVECDALYEIDSDNTATPLELQHKVRAALDQLGQVVPSRQWALVNLAKQDAMQSQEVGRDLAEAALRLALPPHGEWSSIGALAFLVATYELEGWPPTESWEFAVAEELRAGMHRLIELSVDDLLRLRTSD